MNYSGIEIAVDKLNEAYDLSKIIIENLENVLELNSGNSSILSTEMETIKKSILNAKDTVSDNKKKILDIENIVKGG